MFKLFRKYQNKKENTQITADKNQALIDDINRRNKIKPICSRKENPKTENQLIDMVVNITYNATIRFTDDSSIYNNRFSKVEIFIYLQYLIHYACIYRIKNIKISYTVCNKLLTKAKNTFINNINLSQELCYNLFLSRFDYYDEIIEKYNDDNIVSTLCKRMREVVELEISEKKFYFEKLNECPILLFDIFDDLKRFAEMLEITENIFIEIRNDLNNLIDFCNE